MKLLKSLNIADYITLTGIGFAWIGLLLLIDSSPNFAIISMGIAFIFDNLDGYIARKLNISSQFGLELDSFLDFLIYIIFSSLLAHLYLFNNLLVSLIGGGSILIFGSLRLVRMNIVGLVNEGAEKYYIGVISPYIFFLTLVIYFVQLVINNNLQYLNLLLVCIVSISMVSSIKVKKTSNNLIPIIIFVILLISSLYFEYFN